MCTYIERTLTARKGEKKLEAEAKMGPLDDETAYASVSLVRNPCTLGPPAKPSTNPPRSNRRWSSTPQRQSPIRLSPPPRVQADIRQVPSYLFIHVFHFFLFQFVCLIWCWFEGFIVVVIGWEWRRWEDKGSIFVLCERFKYLVSMFFIFILFTLLATCLSASECSFYLKSQNYKF